MSKFTRASLATGHLSGNGPCQCERFFEDWFGIAKVLLTTFYTDALEMSALLMNLQPGDEVIIPSFTFVFTANVFCCGASALYLPIVGQISPIVDVGQMEALIKPKTKAIVVVH